MALVVQDFLKFIFLREKNKEKRGRKEEGGGGGSICCSTRIINSLVASCMCPDQRLNPKAWQVRTTF